MVGLTVAPTWVLMRAGVEGIDPYATAAVQPVLEPLALPIALPKVAPAQPLQLEVDPYQPDPVVPMVPPLPPTPPEPVRERILERGTASGPHQQRPIKKKKKKTKHKKKKSTKVKKHQTKKRKAAPKPTVDELVKKILKQQTALLAARGKPLPGGIVLPPKCPLH